ncbi:DUF2630 family protein [Streptomyces longisporoflavus]|uniref:DUF2630 family protein n=1 Tax=Streptomyces longisporoflavus TaxID=28044 RepID=UPI00167C51AC|nr:DUF2630 family protein [Streptomyces longisporoflavus]
MTVRGASGLRAAARGASRPEAATAHAAGAVPRTRCAKAEFGDDPDEARVRPAAGVEGYRS